MKNDKIKEVVVSIKALIVKYNKFLIVKDLNDNKWELPGGKVDFGEDPNDTLIREINEELNIKIKMGKFLGMCYLIAPDKSRQTVINVFHVIPDSYEIDLNNNPAEESLGELKFVSKDEFVTNDYPVYHESLRTLIKNINIDELDDQY